jgi:hypothetical protein
MIIDDLNVICSIGRPSEANSELLINANTELPFSVTSEGLQSISGRNLQVIQINCGIQEIQFSRGIGMENHRAGLFCPSPLNPVENLLRSFASKGLNHIDRIAWMSCYVNYPSMTVRILFVFHFTQGRRASIWALLM